MTDEYPPIEAFGIVGNMETCALRARRSDWQSCLVSGPPRRVPQRLCGHPRREEGGWTASRAIATPGHDVVTVSAVSFSIPCYSGAHVTRIKYSPSIARPAGRSVLPRLPEGLLDRPLLADGEAPNPEAGNGGLVGGDHPFEFHRHTRTIDEDGPVREVPAVIVNSAIVARSPFVPRAVTECPGRRLVGEAITRRRFLCRGSSTATRPPSFTRLYPAVRP